MTNALKITSALAAAALVAGCKTMPDRPPENNTPVPTIVTAPTPTTVVPARPATTTTATPTATPSAPAAEKRVAYVAMNDKDCQAKMGLTQQSAIGSLWNSATNNALANKLKNADGGCFRMDIAKRASDIQSYVGKISAPNCGILSSGLVATTTNAGTAAVGALANAATSAASNLPARATGTPARVPQGSVTNRPTASNPATSVNETVAVAQRACTEDIKVVTTALTGLVTEWNSENKGQTANVKVITDFNADQYEPLKKFMTGFATPERK